MTSMRGSSPLGTKLSPRRRCTWPLPESLAAGRRTGPLWISGLGRDAMPPGWLLRATRWSPPNRPRLCAQAEARHAAAGVLWLADRLPDLHAVHRLGLAFGL